ncbi:MAG TPA: Na+/H+ antiporter [Anaerolineales bacterium]|nr:Na+/H+ antiporter [Anaerolineales bacterium]
MEQFLSTETLIIELLLIVSLVAIAVRRLQIPYTVALVIVGLLLTAQSQLNLELTPELILALFVPPLVFEAAFHLNLNELRHNMGAILLLAVPGVILTMLIVGGIVSIGTGLALPIALTFGALIAATDPVAVVSLFRMLGVPKRLAVLVEGESLLNDGTALVLFQLMLVVVATGQFNLAVSALDFLRISAGGLVVGLVLGWVISRLIARIDDYLIETTLTTVLAFGSYLIAERLQFSGVLAVVAAGLINGNLGPQGMSPTTRIVLFNFWEYVAFLANSLVFLLIGLEVDLPALLTAWQPILWAIGAVILARLIVVYGLSLLARHLAEPVSMRWQHVLAWGGLRGALSLALALSLPVSFGPDRGMLRTMAFGVVLFTLLVQATTMRPLVRFLGIVLRKPEQVEYEKRHARLTALRSAESHLERRYREGLLSTHTWETLRPKLQEQLALLAEAVRESLRSAPTLEAEEMDIARREILRAQRSAFMGLLQDGVISNEVYENLSAEIDATITDGSNAFWFVPGDSLPQRLKARRGRVDVQEIMIEQGSLCAEKRVRDVAWPRNAVIASLRRGDQVLIARGDTLLLAEDILMMIADDAAINEIQQLTSKPD